MNLSFSSLRPLAFLHVFVITLILVPETAQSSECGVKKSTTRGQNRIINGQDAEVNEWPWMGYLQRREGRRTGTFCGASVIGSRWVITAGHCLRQKNPETLEVVLGAHKKFPTGRDNFEVYKVEKFIMHKGLDKTGQRENDIAVIKVTKDIDLSLHTPICLPGRNKDFAGSQAMATGWGKVSFSGPGGRPQGADVLQEVSLTIERDCGRVPSGTICAIGSSANICGGDSGGPLMVERNGRQTLAGISSYVREKWGNGRCDENKPSFYADVSYYRNWIKQETGI